MGLETLLAMIAKTTAPKIRMPTIMRILLRIEEKRELKAEDEGMITGNRYKNYHIRKNTNPSFKQYVEKSRIKKEHPYRFISLVYDAYSKSLISVSKAATLLNIPVNDVLDKALFV